MVSSPWRQTKGPLFIEWPRVKCWVDGETREGRAFTICKLHRPFDWVAPHAEISNQTILRVGLRSDRKKVRLFDVTPVTPNGTWKQQPRVTPFVCVTRPLIGSEEQIPGVTPVNLQRLVSRCPAEARSPAGWRMDPPTSLPTRTSRGPARLPRIFGPAFDGVPRLPPQGELRHVSLSHQYAASVLKASDRWSVGCRHAVLEQPGPSRCPYSLGVDAVLYRERHAVQRPQTSPRATVA